MLPGGDAAPPPTLLSTTRTAKSGALSGRHAWLVVGSEIWTWRAVARALKPVLTADAWQGAA